MIEHPVPQNVTSYQFHLIGNMTIKQFLLLLSGMGVSFLIYTTNLPGILKWPLIGIFVLTGVAMAFVPYEERSLDQWIVNFARAMYRPTKFFWRRLGIQPDVFDFSPRTRTQEENMPHTPVGARRRQVNQYLSTINAPRAAADTDPLDLLGRELGDLDALFASVEAGKNIVPGEEMQIKPNLQVRSRPLGEIQPAVTQATSAESAGGIPAPAMTSFSPSSSGPVEPVAPPEPKFVPRSPVVEAPAPVTVEPNAPLKFEMPAAAATPTPAMEAAGAVTSQALPNPEVVVNMPAASAPVPVTFNRDLPFPSLPDKPNMLLGMVYDAAGNILPNAILEVINDQGNTVRALKTNPLGQFYTSTPLAAGGYVIEVEKDGFTFPRLALNAENVILEPIEIRAVA